jgi:hypothetical protein
MKLLFRNIPLSLQMMIYDEVVAKLSSGIGHVEVPVTVDNEERKLAVLRKADFVIVSAVVPQSSVQMS